MGQIEYNWDLKPGDSGYLAGKQVAKALEVEIMIDRPTGFVGNKNNNFTRVKKIIAMPNNGT